MRFPTSPKMNRRIASAALIAAALWPAAAWAQPYPSRPIKFIVPFPAGGPADLFARLLGTKLTEELGQQIVIENRAGVGGLTGVDAIAKSAPDGYTVGLSGSAALSAIPFMIGKMPFDWQKDLALLTLVARVPEVLAVHPSVGVATLAEGELLKAEAKIDLVHVPYRGAAPAVNDLLGGHIQMVVFDVPVLLPHIRSGTIKALAVTSRVRAAGLPEVPTSAEAGFASVLSDNWYGLVAPGGTPADILEKLRAAATKALGSDELKTQFSSQDAVPSPTTPGEFASFVKAEQAKWGAVVAATGAKLE